MDNDQIRGRRILLGLSAFLLLPDVLRIVVFTAAHQPVAGAWGSFVLSTSICWCLYKAYAWARGYVTLSLGLSSILALVQLVGGVPTALSRGLFAVAGAIVVSRVILLAFQGTFLWFLWRSPSVAAYIEGENRTVETLNLTG